MVVAWRMMRRKPQMERMRRKESVRKMQLVKLLKQIQPLLSSKQRKKMKQIVLSTAIKLRKKTYYMV